MAKIPLLVLGALAIWIGVELARHGPDEAFGGLLGLLESPQYGEAAPETRSGKLAERAMHDEDEKPQQGDEAWWSHP